MSGMAQAVSRFIYNDLYGGLAQLGEHLPCKQGVESSNLLVSTEVNITSITTHLNGLVAQPVRAHA